MYVCIYIYIYNYATCTDTYNRHMLYSTATATGLMTSNATGSRDGGRFALRLRSAHVCCLAPDAVSPSFCVPV